MKEKITDGVYMKKRFLDSGKIVGTHGIKGELRIDPCATVPNFCAALKNFILTSRAERA